MGKSKLCGEKKSKLLNLFKEGHDYNTIGEELEISSTTVSRFLKKQGLKSTDRERVKVCKQDLTEVGNVYNFLTIKGFEYDERYSSWLAVTLCECGRTSNASIRSIKLGKKKTCGNRNCEHRILLAIQNGKSTFTGHEEILGSRWASWRIGAEKRLLPFEITIEEAWNQFLKQERKCVLSGIELTFHVKYGDDMQTASLDRIDSNIGYLKSNIQWVHKDINMMKGNMSEERFKYLCDLVTNKNN